MKAATYRKYGPPEFLKLEDVAQPLPKDNEVLVRVRAASVTSGDARIRGFRGAGIFWLPLRLMFGIFGPRNPIPGMEFAGEIESVGKAITLFRAGEPVFGIKLHGANAEYTTIAQDGAIATKPDMITDAQAAAIPFGALSALVFLRDIARLQAGQKILVYGASGNVGVFAVQLAKFIGAEVTGVCSSANLDLVKSLGADKAIDYTKEDFIESGETYDIIFDTIGATSFGRCKRALAANGRHVFLVAKLPQLFQMLWTSIRGGKRALCGVSGTAKNDLLFIKSLIEAGKIRPVIDQIFSLDRIVKAHRYVDTGRKTGSVVIALNGDARHMQTGHGQAAPKIPDRFAPSLSRSDAD